MRGAELLERDQCAAAEIFEHRHAGTASELRERARLDVVREAVDSIV